MEEKKVILLGALVVLLLLGAFLFGPFAIVGAGERGVLTTFGKVEPYSLGEGFHWKIPFVQSIITMDVKTQKYEANSRAASRDLQEVSTSVTVNYHIDPPQAWRIYQTIGVDFGSKVIQPAVQESVKAATAKFNAEQLITQRPIVKREIEDTLKARLSQYGITQEAVSITEFQFSEQFDKAIEKKVTAEQEALEAENILKRKEIEAQQEIAVAQGQATALLTIAQAEAEANLVIGEAEAKVLALQREAISRQLINLRTIEKWNGVLPLFSGGGAVPFIDIESVTGTAKGN